MSYGFDAFNQNLFSNKIKNQLRQDRRKYVPANMKLNSAR